MKTEVFLIFADREVMNMFGRLLTYRHKYKMNKLLKSGMQVGKNTLLFNKAEDFGGKPDIVEIGSDCVVASGVKFITNPGMLKYRLDKNDTSQQGGGGSQIIIRDNCFIGIDSVIYPNIIVGPNAIVGAGSVVTADVPPNMCVCGNPSRSTCTIDLYAQTCKRGLIPGYDSKNKRNILQKYFWNIEERE